MLQNYGENTHYFVAVRIKMLRYYAGKGYINKAERTSREILKTKIIDPDQKKDTYLRVHTIMMHAYCVENNTKKAEDLLNKMMNGEKCSPDNITFETLLLGCTFGKDTAEKTERAERLWLQMQALEICPTKSTIDLRIFTLSRAGDITNAQNLLNSMHEKYYVAPDANSYRRLTDGCISSDHI